jgi:hypothetical protein
MRRRRFKPGTVLPLVLLVGAAALWGRSYWRTDELALTYRGDGAEQLRCRRGNIAFIHTLTRPNVNRDSFGAIKFTATPDQSGTDGVFVLEEAAIRHGWHGFSYDTVDEPGIVYAGAMRAAILSQCATIDDYLARVNRGEESIATSKDRETLVRMQRARKDSQSILTSIGPIPKAPQWRIVAPIWSLMLAVVSVWLLLWLASWSVRRRRRVRGLCAACGYDLTANVSGVCPECGRNVVV